VHDPLDGFFLRRGLMPGHRGWLLYLYCKNDDAGRNRGRLLSCLTLDPPLWFRGASEILAETVVDPLPLTRYAVAGR
jgi:hypothetical protein